MSNSSLLGAIARRWWIVILIAIAGATAGAIPEPEKVDEQVRSFTATHTMVLNETDPNQQAGTVISPNQVTLFVTTGEVPARAADAIDFNGNPATLASQVQSEFDFSTTALTITSTQPDGERAELIADTFANELISYLAERQDVIYEQRLAASLDRLSGLEQDLTEVTRQLARAPQDPVLIAQQSAVSRQYSVAFEQSELLAANPPVIGFTTLQRAQAVEITDRGLGAPTSRSSRALLGGIVGLALGLGIALLLGQLDRRIRTKEQAEEVLDLRSRVVIPKVRDKDRDQLIVASTRHDSLSDSYRTVRNIVDFIQSHETARDGAQVTLVVSPGPGDGKTSLSANVAAAIAESGRRTILMNSDFRRPRLARLFGEPSNQPLPFLLEDIERVNARTLLTATEYNRLKLFDLSSIDGPAGELVRASIDKLGELTELSDAVVVDTSPVGATAEVLEFVPHAHTIVMIVRVGHTRVADAKRSIAILRDLSTAPIVLVLGGLRAKQAPYYEYDDRRRQNSQPARRWRRRTEYPSDPDNEPELESVE